MNDNLKGKIAGLCGTYNGDRLDDFQTQGGPIANSVGAFGNSWKKTNVGKSLFERETRKPRVLCCHFPFNMVLE